MRISPPPPMVLAAMVLVGGVPALAHDSNLTPEQESALVRFMRSLESVEGEGGIQPCDVAVFDRDLAVIPSILLRHIPDSPQFHALPENLKGMAGEGLWAVEFLRATRHDLSNAVAVSCWLSGHGREKLSRGMIALLSQPFDDGLGRVVVRLSRESRPDLRLLAGIAAKCFFRAKGMHAGMLEVGKNLLVDRDPAVAANFGLLHCCDFMSAKLVDKMISRLGDNRMPDYDGLTLGVPSRGTVGRSFADGLIGYFMFHTPDEGASTTSPDGVQRTIEGTISEVREWWDRTRESAFVGPKGKWRLLFSGCVPCEVGKLEKIPVDDGELSLTIKHFHPVTGTSFPGYVGEVEALLDTKNSRSRLSWSDPNGRLGRFKAAGTDGLFVRTLLLPGPDEKVRVILEVWGDQE